MQTNPDACSQNRKRKRRAHRHSTEAAPPLSPSVILFYYHANSEDYDCSVYALNTAAVLEDKGDDTKPLPQPLFRFHQNKFPILPGYAALGSKIYIFGGINSVKNKKKKNQSGMVQLASSTFTMLDNPGTFGHPIACFPM
ncbi:IKI3-like protein [Corchorus capsularis]|uniref:IKI3-like protein n=1 Tax=Corchorus capsularis TaxID=210143 RepID=A0A1R3G1D0_COCAP|nr:IKI3-like protein [Corchorus capsularis]